MKRLVFAAILLLIVACEENATPATTGTPYIGGKEGITMKFIDGMPPDYVFDKGGYGFGIGVQLDNVAMLPHD